jgi:hypothetical protein
MARNLAALPDRCVFLDFDKGTDLGFVADFAAVQVDEFREPDVLSKLHVIGDTNVRMHGFRAKPFWKMTCCQFHKEQATNREG